MALLNCNAHAWLKQSDKKGDTNFRRIGGIYTHFFYIDSININAMKQQGYSGASRWSRENFMQMIAI